MSEERVGPHPTDPEVHSQILNLKISIDRSKYFGLLSSIGTVFPLVESIDPQEIIREIQNEEKN